MNPNTMVNITNKMEVIFSLEGRTNTQNGRVDMKIARRINGRPAVMVSTEMQKTHISLTLGSILWIIVCFCS